MKQIKVNDLGVNVLSEKELVETNGGGFIGDMIGSLLTIMASLLNPVISRVMTLFGSFFRR